jgi:NTP pyrophosphatase (non-canonical NTP hydrolase)
MFLEISPEIRRSVIKQNNERELWSLFDTEENVGDYFFEEAIELNEAIEKEKPPIEVASEVGDIFYLGIKYGQYTGREYIEFPDKMKAVLEYASYVCHSEGIDPNDCLKMKILRNELKYPAFILNNSGRSYEEAVSLCRRMWESQGGDEAFYKWYVEFAEEL